MLDKKNDGNDEENNGLSVLTDEEIENLDLKSEKTKKLRKQYEKDTGKHAIWRDNITESFKKWLKGEKIYDRDKERVSLYISEEIKKEWQDFIKTVNDISSLSDLIRVTVSKFIEDSKKNNRDLAKSKPKNIAKISHDLKESLTSIKGFSQLLLENYKDDLEEEILTLNQNIFDQSLLLENTIKSLLDDSKTESSQYDILLIEDDLATIYLLTNYFERKGYSCHGVVSGSKGLEELGRTSPKVILLDIMLPDLSGYDICKMIKSDKKYKKIPIYFLTAISASEVKSYLNETKPDGIILKPFNFADFEVIFDILKGLNLEKEEDEKDDSEKISEKKFNIF